jgi:hypothetical protein
MDKILKGDLSKAFVIAKLLKEGYKVFRTGYRKF